MSKQVTNVKVEKKLAVSEDQVQQFKEAFDMFDKDGSGKISIDEIHSVMKNMGNEISKEEIKAMIADLDEDGSGEIDFEEFITFMERTVVQEDLSEEEEVIRAFQTFDKDNNGWLSCAEFKHILTNLGDRFTDEEVKEIFKEADLDHDGRITYREFVDFWKTNNHNDNNDEINVENMTDNLNFNSYSRFDHQATDEATGGWSTHTEGNIVNQPTVRLNEEEENRINERRKEEDERRGRIIQLMNDEIRIKQEARDQAREYIINFENQRRIAVEKRKQFNKSNEEQMINNKTQMKSGKSNSWERVVDNIELKESDYKGKNDISRMRNVIVARKNDFSQMELK